MSNLVITKPGDDDRQTIALVTGEQTIGRAPQHGIVLAGDHVSREHARIIGDGEDFFVIDLGSENGTLLNHVPLRAHERYILRSNDLLIIGDYHLRFSRHDELEQSFNEITGSDIVEVKLLKQVLRALESESRPSLQVLNGAAEGKALVIPEEMQELYVGRDPSCDFPIEEYVISRRHARLARDGRSFTVEDLQSKNGTYVNNRRVTTADVHDGDRIAFGTIVCMFRHPQEVNVDDVKVELQQRHDAVQERLASQRAARRPPPPPADDLLGVGDDDDADEGTEFAENADGATHDIADAKPAHAYPPPRPHRSLWQRLSPVEIGLLWGGVMILLVTVVLLIKLVV